MAALLRSQLECPFCHDLIASLHRHDFQTCGCGGLSIDGGRDYLRVAYREDVGEILMAKDGMNNIDRSISIAGEHTKASAALALEIYKALWEESHRGEHHTSAAAVHRRVLARWTAGRYGPPPSYKGVIAYLKLFIDDDGPVEGGSKGYKPLVPLAERPDAP